MANNNAETICGKKAFLILNDEHI